MAKYTSKLQEDVAKHSDLIERGHMLCIDPSSGSAGSMPGYAVFKAGKLLDAGTLSLPRGREIHSRLWLLAETMRQEFEKPDILAVEWIAPVIPTGKGTFLHKSASALIKSVGAILSVWDVPVIEPSPAFWHSISPPGYVKSDAKDAQMIGWAALTTATRLRKEADPQIHLIEG